VFDKNVPVSGDGSYTIPTGFIPSKAGTYWWTASYDGDANNDPIASACDQEQVTLAKASPAITTAPGANGTGTVGSTTVTDTATLPGSYNPTGTIQFTAYGPSAAANCTTASADTEAVTVTGTGGYTTPDGFTPAQAGTYWWTASYDGDANNNPAAVGSGATALLTLACMVMAATPGAFASKHPTPSASAPASVGPGVRLALSFHGVWRVSGAPE
jgi:hypothetical protein